MAKYVCSICGYTYEGNETPERCPLCKSPSSQFIIVENADEIEAQNTEKAIGVKEKSTINAVEKNVHKEEDIGSTNIMESALCSEEDDDYVFEKQEKTATKNDSLIYDESVKNNEDGHNSGNKKTFLIIIGAVALLFLVGLLSNNSTQSEQDDVVANNDSIVSVDSVEIDIKSAEYITKYLEETINQAITEDLERALTKYFTKDFVSLYKEVDEIDNRNSGEIGFWDSDFWTGWQDGEINSVKVLEIKNMTGNSATAMIQ